MKENLVDLETGALSKSGALPPTPLKNIYHENTLARCVSRISEGREGLKERASLLPPK